MGERRDWPGQEYFIALAICNWLIRMSSLSRIQKELADFNLTPHPYFSLSVINEYDLYNLHALILGPESTPYEGGTFHIDIELPPNYPFRPPKLNFLTKIFHPNISEIEVCHNLFRYDWIPTVTIFKSLETVIDLMRNPKTYVSINTDIAAICVADRKKYDQIAREWTQQYAK